MADEKKVEESSGGGGNKLIIIIIAAVVVLLLIIAAVVAVLILSGDDEIQQQAQSAPVSGGGNPAQNMRSGGNVFLSMGPIYKFDQLIVNLSSQGGRRYLKTTVDAELSTDKLALELDTKIPALRDVLISVLSSKTIEEISTVNGKEKLKDELVERMNESLVDGKIVNIFFTEFVVQ